MAKHRLFLLAIVAAFTLGSCAREELSDAEIVALDAVALRAQIVAGRISALRVTQAYLRRIAALDDSGPTLSAVIELNPDAEAIARRLDEQLERGVPGPLYGVPVLLKANIDTADRMATSAGSLALAEHYARADADIVARLRAAGAVVLGKTNLSEWANFRGRKSTSGWSSLGGQTRNAYVLDRNPCGSSSGSAVAVAARLAPLAVGTETDGSIVCPAGVNGVVGIKPAIGTVSQRGIVPIAHSQDTAGPLARNVADAALLLSVLAEAGTAPPVSASVADATGLRVGVIRAGAGRDAAVDATFAQALEELQRAGAVLVDPVEAALGTGIADAELAILVAEYREDLAAYLTGVARGPRTIDELIAFNTARAGEVMPYFGQEFLLAARDNGGTGDAAYRTALETVAAARSALAELFAQNELDALVAPTNGRAWRTNYTTGDSFRTSSSRIAAVTGYPSVTVPVRLADELPLGVSFIGKPGDESSLLALGAAIERERGAFPEPRFLPSID
ncbi:MAG TPA: amidase [Gammaproteobacteria bacterium]|nr:amidase [Gammaproteobacteria bacterium]